MPQLCPPDSTQPLGYIHLPGESPCSPESAENACMIIHIDHQGQCVLRTHSMMSGSYSQEPGVSLLPENLSLLLSLSLSATQKFSLCSGAGFIITLRKSHRLHFYSYLSSIN